MAGKPLPRMIERYRDLKSTYGFTDEQIASELQIQLESLKRMLLRSDPHREKRKRRGDA